VQSRKFREALEDAMLRYTNKAISTAEMIARLIDLVKHLRDAQRHGEVLGLSNEETAFYDALAENGSAREVMKSDTLRLMARELTEMVKKMPSLTGLSVSRYERACDAMSAGCWPSMASRKGRRSSSCDRRSYRQRTRSSGIAWARWRKA
jgi:hypothetical protein